MSRAGTQGSLRARRNTAQRETLTSLGSHQWLPPYPLWARFLSATWRAQREGLCGDSVLHQFLLRTDEVIE
jgi:hypothetical protein